MAVITTTVMVGITVGITVVTATDMAVTTVATVATVATAAANE
eukprot:CAMPEP_0170464082 /NCGR_PEP_ID=MMETSP0123-20130129/8948_1 /TAXON_ID=182087 /ORGANISM="Favella ehrenbergii, Strain Fehren 1" /LENGTH=42 /DNA_ID= /DNA_START= /DNA_END= /DNA_ORIENTATION=